MQELATIKPFIFVVTTALIAYIYGLGTATELVGFDCLNNAIRQCLIDYGDEGLMYRIRDAVLRLNAIDIQKIPLDQSIPIIEHCASELENVA